MNGPRIVLALLAAAILTSTEVGAAPQQDPAIDAAVVARLASLPRDIHHSEVRADYDAARDRTRVWINTNEDDSRVWSSGGAQLDMEFRASAVLPGRAGTRWPREVSLDIASLGTLRPAIGPSALTLSADGRAVALVQSPAPEARSGDLLFLEIKVTVPIVEFLRLVAAHRVEGRVWGHAFALVPHQMEILRAFAWQLAAR
jgi:hypothetical protein